jgi:hypothetical protein
MTARATEQQDKEVVDRLTVTLNMRVRGPFGQ